jgi:hypothetical protein
LLQFIHVIVGIAQAARLTKTDTVDDAGMVQRIADDGILFVEQSFEQTAVRVEAR